MFHEYIIWGGEVSRSKRLETIRGDRMCPISRRKTHCMTFGIHANLNQAL
jgi:hypothetical protein